MERFGYKTRGLTLLFDLNYDRGRLVVQRHSWRDDALKATLPPGTDTIKPIAEMDPRRSATAGGVFSFWTPRFVPVRHAA